MVYPILKMGLRADFVRGFSPGTANWQRILTLTGGVAFFQVGGNSSCPCDLSPAVQLIAYCQLPIAAFATTFLRGAMPCRRA